jgi:hypothetical protein
MKRLGRALLVVVAVCGIFAGTATSAFAHEWQIKGMSLKALGLGSQGFTSSGGKFEFDWFVLGEHQKWSCLSQSASGQLLPEGKLESTIKYSGCGFTAGVFAAEQCVISTPIESLVNGELAQVGEKAYVRYSGKAQGKTLIVKLTNCMSAGTWAFSGTFSALAEPFGVQLVEQPRTFSQAIDEANGTKIIPSGSPSNPVWVSGSAKEKLTGAFAGVIWGAT